MDFKDILKESILSEALLVRGFFVEVDKKIPEGAVYHVMNRQNIINFDEIKVDKKGKIYISVMEDDYFGKNAPESKKLEAYLKKNLGVKITKFTQDIENF